MIETSHRQFLRAINDIGVGRCTRREQPCGTQQIDYFKGKGRKPVARCLVYPKKPGQVFCEQQFFVKDKP